MFWRILSTPTYYILSNPLQLQALEIERYFFIFWDICITNISYRIQKGYNFLIYSLESKIHFWHSSEHAMMHEFVICPQSLSRYILMVFGYHHLFTIFDTSTQTTNLCVVMSHSISLFYPLLRIHLENSFKHIISGVESTEWNQNFHICLCRFSEIVIRNDK